MGSPLQRSMGTAKRQWNAEYRDLSTGIPLLHVSREQLEQCFGSSFRRRRILPCDQDAMHNYISVPVGGLGIDAAMAFEHDFDQERHSSQKPVLWPVSSRWSCEVKTINAFMP